MNVRRYGLSATVLALSLICAVPAWAGADSAGVIVKLRSDATAARLQTPVLDRRSALAARLGVKLEGQAGPAPDTLWVRSAGVDDAQLAARLAAEPDVVYAQPDLRKSIRRVPNDPLYAEQWLMGQSQPAALNAESAWDITTGSAAVTVAVIDTGVRYDHEDLPNLLPGFDFISNVDIANDGDGRDADASDPGDYLTAADLRSEFFAGCGGGFFADEPTSSSWHGTRVSGVVAAAGNNSRGLAGVSWNARVLPLRALGKCGGFDSDIVAAMRWAGGLEVPGVPPNPNPAKILNLSLGGSGACTPLYAETVEALRAAGVLVVAAAGNAVEVESPGNCPGVLTVAGLRHVGTKVGYSSFGVEVDVSAPAGNCVNELAGQPCLFQIPTTLNLGSTTPAGNGYSDGFNPTYGTSFSSPMAAGVAALMLSVHPGLMPDALIHRIRSTARPFPVEAGLPQCPQLDPFSGQCGCTVTTCGAGMLDAAAAVSEALRPQAVWSSAPDGNAAIGLSAAGSSASVGSQLVGWSWAQLDGPTTGFFDAPQSPSSRFQGALAGEYVLELTVEDSAGRRDAQTFKLILSQDQTVAPPDPAPAPDPEPAPPPSGSGGGGSVDGASLAGLLCLLMLAHRVRRSRPRA